jgi:radical SAM protein
MRDETLTRTLQRYESAPHLVFWETTKACGLACRHCRASAQTAPLPGELTTAEGRGLLDQIAAMEGPRAIVVFTGGDCFERADLDELIAYALALGLRVGVAPSVTPKVTRESLQRLYDLGVRAVSISLDGASSESHDSLRGIADHFRATLDALAMMRDMGFRLQVNTTVMDHNKRELADILALVRDAGVSIWEVFFLVSVGRGSLIREVSATEAEDICHFLVDAADRGLTVRTVEAPFFRRVQAERAAAGDVDAATHFGLGELYRHLRDGLERVPYAARPRSSASLATGDGRGVIFVGYDGEVHASGFLPVALGNVRERPLGEIYTTNEVLTSLRAGELEGECGRCEYQRLCGGSRARAYARTGRVLGDDPACVRTRASRAHAGLIEVRSDARASRTA